MIVMQSPAGLGLAPAISSRGVYILVFLAVGLCLSAVTRPLAAAAEDTRAALPSALVTPGILASKIAEVEAATDLQDDIKIQLVDLYRKALGNLEETTANAARAEAFERATRMAPTQTQQIRDDIAAAKRTGPDPLATLGVRPQTPLEQIEQKLRKEQADLAAVDARRADFERRLVYQEIRPATISQRLAEAKQQQEDVAEALPVPSEADEPPAQAQARRWVLETRYMALSTEIKMLDQELLSHSMRVELLQAKRDRATASVAWIDARVRELGERVNRKRRLDAAQAKTEAEKTRRETAGSDPLLIRLSEQNTELTDEVKAMATRLDALDREQTQAGKLAKRIAAEFKDARATVETGGLTEGLGRVLLEQRQSLPNIQALRSKIRAREQQIAEIGVRRLRHQAEARRIADLDQTVSALEAEVSAEQTLRLRGKLRDLVEQRQLLLEKALDANEFYLRRLHELDAVERKLLDTQSAYDNFLIEHLLWLRSADPTRLKDLLNLPEEVRQLLSTAARAGLIDAFIDQAANTKTFWLVLLVAAALLWQRRALITAIEGTAKRLGKPTTDSFADTLRAGFLTLIVAAPLPLLAAVAGWQLEASTQGSELSRAVGGTLVTIALYLYALRVLRAICMPRGLAAAHFRGPESSLRLLRIELDRLTWIFVPLGFLVLIAIDLNPAETGGTFTRFSFLISYGALTLFFYRVFHPKRGVFAFLRSRRASGLIFRTYPAWYTLLLLYPPGLVVLALNGYLYSVVALSDMLEQTLLLITGLVLLNALALRWLLIIRRRLAYEAAVERRQVALAVRQAGETGATGDEGGPEQFEEPEVDLEALSEESRELVKIVLVFTGLVGLYLIWSTMLPALRIFDDVTLWHYTVTVGAEDRRLPVTLADLGLALIYAAGIGVLAKRLPALLEMILLRRFHLSSGSRYAVTTLSNYAIVAAGIVLILNTIGAQWSQLQWLVAALGVGIGFGLQEIIANFISGLIILFERPIRVGDIVTVGDTTGVVTKIRIRATTIRNWDRKELLVPNKQFITGQLLNWSLSDQIIRVMVTVGVAYETDVDKALLLMKEVAQECAYVVDDPAPILSFEGFGENSLKLVLRAYLSTIDYFIPTITELHKAINHKFAQAGIVIAFPQRDLHLDTREPLRVSIENTRQASE